MPSNNLACTQYKIHEFAGCIEVALFVTNMVVNICRCVLLYGICCSKCIYTDEKSTECTLFELNEHPILILTYHLLASNSLRASKIRITHNLLQVLLFGVLGITARN